MTVRISFDSSAELDDVNSLVEFIGTEDELRGRVAAAPGELVPERLGFITDVIEVAVASGGAVTALITSVSDWMRSHKSDITVDIDNGDGRKVTVAAKRIQSATVADLRELIDDACRQLSDPSPTT